MFLFLDFMIILRNRKKFHKALGQDDLVCISFTLFQLNNQSFNIKFFL